VVENHRLPIVVIEASIRHVSLLEPEDKAGLATLTGYLLDEGTKAHTGSQIAEMIEDVGGVLSMSNGGGGVKVLAPHRGLALKLLFECLSQPNFPNEAFNRQKQRLLAEIADANQQPDVKALLTYRQLAYGKHPLARPSF